MPVMNETGITNGKSYDWNVVHHNSVGRLIDPEREAIPVDFVKIHIGSSCLLIEDTGRRIGKYMTCTTVQILLIYEFDISRFAPPDRVRTFHRMSSIDK